jgi:dihydroorotase
MVKKLVFKTPFDAHVHFRKGSMLQLVTPFTARQFGGAFVMPNCDPKILTSVSARAYHKEIMDALPADINFVPRIAVYLTDATNADDLVEGFQSGTIAGVKFYPLGATTGSDAGISSVQNVAHILKAMEQAGIPLHIHGESIKDGNGHKLNPFAGFFAIIFLLIEVAGRALPVS